MKRRLLGRTGLEASVMGLGCGGHSRLGRAYGRSAEDSMSVVGTALDEGINFFDTAPAYKTEAILGKALAGVNREDYVLSTKISLPPKSLFGIFRDKKYFETQLHNSLKALKTDHVDIFSLHGVRDEQYPSVRERYLEYLRRFKEQGKVRFLGITETWPNDPTHKMLSRAIEDNLFEVIMVGINFVNQSALKSVFPQAVKKKMGIQIMFAVRRGLSSAEAVRETVNRLVEQGVVDRTKLDSGEDPLGFLTQPDVSEGYTDAAYRYCVHLPGAQVVLSGTGSPKHLRTNATSLGSSPLPREVEERLREIFEKVESETCN